MRDTEQEILRATSEHVVALFSLTQRKSTPLDDVTRQRATDLMNDQTARASRAAAPGCARRSRRAKPTPGARRRHQGRRLHRRRRLCRPVDRDRASSSARPSTDVAIVEADICGGGASGRNSGMVLSQWAKFAALEAFCGTKGAIRLGHEFGNSASNIEDFCREHGIDAEFRRDGWIWGATCARQVGSWNGILAALAKHDYASVPAVDRATEIARAHRQPVVPGGHLRSDSGNAPSRQMGARAAPRRAEARRAHL